MAGADFVYPLQWSCVMHGRGEARKTRLSAKRGTPDVRGAIFSLATEAAEARTITGYNWVPITRFPSPKPS